jgi:hypothetical protein
MTQVYLSGHGVSAPEDDEVAAVASSLVTLWSPTATALSFCSSSFLSFLSPGVAGEAVDPVALLKSKAVPGVFGVFDADPKEANAPLPRPNAEDAVEFGDVTPDVLKGAMALKGLERLCEEVSPP